MVESDVCATGPLPRRPANDEMSTLLQEWKRAIPGDLPFVEDGIISETHWAAAKTRVVFVLKETNDYDRNIAESIRVAATDRPKSQLWQRPTFHNVGRWAYGLLQEPGGAVAPFADAHRFRKEALLSCAFINLKKTSGGRTATKAVDTHARAHAHFLRRQFEILAPDIIVLGGTYAIVREHVLPGLRRVPPRIHVHGEVTCINASHPACTKPRSEMYDQVVGCYRRWQAERWR